MQNAGNLHTQALRFQLSPDSCKTNTPGQQSAHSTQITASVGDSKIVATTEFAKERAGRKRVKRGYVARTTFTLSACKTNTPGQQSANSTQPTASVGDSKIVAILNLQRTSGPKTCRAGQLARTSFTLSACKTNTPGQQSAHSTQIKACVGDSKIAATTEFAKERSGLKRVKRSYVARTTFTLSACKTNTLGQQSAHSTQVTASVDDSKNCSYY